MDEKSSAVPLKPLDEALYEQAGFYARRFEFLVTACNVVIYVHFGLALTGVVPYWSLLISAAVLVPRWMLSVHELFHQRSEHDVSWITRILPLGLTPLALGYKEYRDIHFGHHRYMATSKDPDFFHIRGSKLSGLLNAMTAVDQAFFRYACQKGVDQELFFGALARLGVFVCLVAISGHHFLWYFIPVRLVYGASYFSFFYCLHRRRGAYGVYPLILPRPLSRLFLLLFGRDVLLAMTYHHVHHENPRIGARDLSNSVSVMPGDEEAL